MTVAMVRSRSCFQSIGTATVTGQAQPGYNIGDDQRGLERSDGLEWMNTSRPLVASDLRGRVVVLDFFTYCCINCQHLLPTIRLLEETCPADSGLLVIGVHSAKFDHEKRLANVANALLRLGITHPVVNDSQSWLWQRLRINCWPTLVVLGPSGQLLLSLVGEGAAGLLVPFCRAALAHFRPASLTPLPLAPGTFPVGPLLFPAKVCATETRLVISDTGHHRILIADRGGKVLLTVGGPEPGYEDSSLDEARFRDPQGVIWRDPHFVLVADTGNHAIREVDLERRTVQTLAGTGQQGTDTVGGHLGPDQPLNSPWDICLVDNVVYIAMAGSHQVWALFLEDTVLYGKQLYDKGTCACIAGNGEERNRNNSYPLRASFAQPSGISFQPPCSLHIADSESSSIRTLSLKDGAVKNLVGGGLNPTDLFSFGDADGVALEAKLQHPLGVAWSSAKERLYVADSYNHKIREVDVKSRLCRTLFGGGEGGSCQELGQLNEPGGLSVTGAVMYVADTNNHCIKVFDLNSSSVEILAVTLPDVTDSDRLSEGKKVSNVILAPEGKLCIVIEPPNGLAAGAPSRWKIHFNKQAWKQPTSSSGSLEATKSATCCLTLQRHDPGESLDVQVVLEAYICTGDVCMPRKYSFIIPVTMGDQGAREQEYCISKDMYA
ncbi:NHL repeat-containing protein 2-like isoform X2 [Haemaphysalis longicornis]